MSGRNPGWHIVPIIVIGLIVSALYHWYAGKKAVVDLELTTTAATTLKIYWAAEPDRFSERWVEQVNLHPGSTHYSMHIGDVSRIRQLRVDTSDDRPAEVTIKRFRISQAGYRTIEYATPEELGRFRSHAGIRRLEVDEQGLRVVPETGDPQLLLEVPSLTPGSDPFGEAVRFLAIALLICSVFTGFYLSGQGLAYVPYLLVFVLALIIVMAVVSKNNRHPDENVHVQAACYFQNHVQPPKIGIPEIRDSYSVYGISRLHSGEIVYPVAGKFLNLIEPFKLGSYLSARFFNVLLFLFLVVLSVKLPDFRPFMLPVLISSQVWYIFSYFNSDAFALVVSLVAGYLLAHPGSLLHVYLAQGAGGRRWLFPLASGGLLGLLLLVKKNFYFFDLFLFLYFLWAIRFNRIQLSRAVVCRLGLILLLGSIVSGTFLLADWANNDFNKSQRLEQAQEMFALKQFKPSTPLADKHPFLQMRDRGVGMTELLADLRWGTKMFWSSFGVYGYGSISGSFFYYECVKITGLLLSAIIVISLLVRERGRLISLLGIMMLVWAGLGTAALGHAWMADFQAQGRYLLPGLPMAAILLYHLRNQFPRLLFHPLTGAMCLLAVYNYVFIGLYEIDKFGR